MRSRKSYEVERVRSKEDNNSSTGNDESGFLFGNQIALVTKYTFLLTMVVLFSTYVCSEFAILSYLPAFGFKCQLHLSKQEASNLMAGFVFGFAMAR